MTVKINASIGENNILTMYVSKAAGENITIPFSTKPGTDSQCPLADTGNLTITETLNSRSTTIKPTAVSWGNGVSFTIQPGATYKFSNTTFGYYKLPSTTKTVCDVTGYYLVTTAASYNTLKNSSISLGYKNK